MSTKQKSDLIRDAHGLYMSGHYTQEEIANRVGITRRTFYNWMQQGNWQRARQNAIVAPTIITENFISAIIELQTAISQRPIGLRYPTPHETNTLSKLLACITRMSAFPTEALQQAALNQQNFADPTSLNPQANFANTFAPYHTIQQLQQVEKMGNESSQFIDNQDAHPSSPVENNGQFLPKHEELVIEESTLEEDPIDADGLSAQEKKMAITKWFISRKLYPMGMLNVSSPDGSIDRQVTTDEMQYLYGYGYTQNDIYAALNFGIRA